MDFSKYNTDGFFDELFDEKHKPRSSAKVLIEKLETLTLKEFKQRQVSAELALLNMGITFSLASGDDQSVERIFPFDILPRIISSKEWEGIEKGLKQRIRALNIFLDDIYNEQKILKDKIIPEEIIHTGEAFSKPCVGLKPPKGIWNHITGTDLIRDKDGTVYVLEDNLRCPSGVSYVIENRLVMKRIFSSVFQQSHVKPIDDYSSKLLDTLSFAATSKERCNVAVLTPGIYNSAYFEHAYLAQQMGAYLVEGQDLVVRKDGYVYMRTTEGFERVDVIYRRIDDNFIDPTVFRPDSCLGIPGIMKAFKEGKVSLCNAPGTGIADDKVVYKFVPDMIKYYLDEEPLLPNVPTYLCSFEKERNYVLENLDKLVVKSANEAGGYGMLIGPASTKKQQKEFAAKIKAKPRNFMAQPTISLSRAPTFVNGRRFEGRHVDVRPYILYGEDIYVLPGGLTRVALKKGSLVVNSSQGGGSKDTWVVEERENNA
ncbi:MAG: circularly permuted type 2 ATP-grasp protein [Nitrospinae bacterium]|nr:circularly permuted type 2 ATP-grasp protein [Nitrospinota bacterium]